MLEPGRAVHRGLAQPDPRVARRSGRAGRGEVFTDTANNWWLAYHAYQEPLVGYPNSRLLYFSPISLDAVGRPTISP